MAAQWEEMAAGRAARERAEALLRELLTAAECGQLERLGFLEVPSPTHPGRVYRVPRRRGRVTVLEGGAPVMLLCVGPVRALPDGDVVLLHKLMIEGDEAEYLRVANRLDPARPGPLLRPIAR